MTNDICPKCLADLQGKPIPPDQAHHWTRATHFSRRIGVTCPKADRIIKWRCPDCNHEWPRKA